MRFWAGLNNGTNLMIDEDRYVPRNPRYRPPLSRRRPNFSKGKCQRRSFPSPKRSPGQRRVSPDYRTKMTVLMELWIAPQHSPEKLRQRIQRTTAARKTPEYARTSYVYNAIMKPTRDIRWLRVVLSSRNLGCLQAAGKLGRRQIKS